ncbi:MAG: hypothetical protein K2X93_18390 [Candidatus Obscuribacterales bacterium]|nr:hypothetical protein [Candidatus Obscuribacterales bacterium]
MRFAVLVVLTVVIQFSHQKTTILLAEENPSDLAIIPSPQTMKLVSLGYDQLLADVFWLNYVGYLGDTEARLKDHYALCDRYLDLITYLDPQFVQPYWFSAFTVGGDQSRPERARELIDRGIDANPNDWHMPFIAGINQYLFAHDESAAARYYRVASKFPDAPSWLDVQATIIETKAPRLVKEASSWLSIYETADEPRVKEKAREKSIYLWVQVYKVAPNELFRDKAKKTLKSLGVDIDSVVTNASRKR